MDIIQLIRSKKFFGPYFKDIGTWSSWETFLKTLFGLPLSKHELPLLRDCTGLEKDPGRSYRESYIIAGRRSGKSTIAALLAVYISLFVDWASSISRGEKPVVIIIAVNKAQAAIVKGYIEGLLGVNETFRAAVARILQESIELRNGLTILVKPASFRSLRGFTICAAILEELSFYRFELESANPDREILTALKPGLASIPSSLLIGIGTPYVKQGSLYEKFKRDFGKSGAMALIWKAPTRTMNPTIPIETVDQAFREDPEAAAAEWGAEFRADISTFIDPLAVEAAVVPGCMVIPWSPEREFHGFIDMSAGRSDSATLALAFNDAARKRSVLANVQEAKSPFNPASVVEAFCGILKEYRVSEVEADAYAGEWVVGSFREYGVSVLPSKKTKSEIYLELLPLLNSGSAELLDVPRLLHQLKSLERRARGSGRDLVDSFYPGSHDDVINAAAGALVMASERSGIQEGRVFLSGQPASSTSSSSEETPEIQGDQGRVFFKKDQPVLDLSDAVRAVLDLAKKDKLDEEKRIRDLKPPAFLDKD
jgi:hypothetical protein